MIKLQMEDLWTLPVFQLSSYTRRVPVPDYLESKRRTRLFKRAKDSSIRNQFHPQSVPYRWFLESTAECRWGLSGGKKMESTYKIEQRIKSHFLLLTPKQMQWSLSLFRWHCMSMKRVTPQSHPAFHTAGTMTNFIISSGNWKPLFITGDHREWKWNLGRV